MNIEIIVLGGTDKTIRFQLVVAGENTGELQMDRANFTKIADKLFEGEYRLTKQADSDVAMSNTTISEPQ